jgi:hypothetical protein
LLHFRYSGIPGALLQDAWEGLSPAFMGRSVGSWIMIAVYAASSDCRVPAGKTCRSADIHCAQPFRGESGALSANERRPQSSPRKTGQEEKTPILHGISVLRLIREGSGFASACLRNSRRLRDAGVLPVPTTGQPRRDQAEKMSGGVKRPSARQLGVSTNSRSDPFLEPARA